MPDHALPEEKLLNLIRNKSQGKVKGASTPPQPLKSGEPAAEKKARKGDVGNIIKVLNFTFIILTIVFASYAGYQYFFLSQKNVAGITMQAEKIPQENPPADVVAPALKPLSYYASPVEERDLFETDFFQKKKSAETKSAVPLPDLTKSLRLVGVILDRFKEAIIEDTQLKQTFFVHQGDRINEAVVEEIQEGKVILLYGDQKVELTQ